VDDSPIPANTLTYHFSAKVDDSPIPANTLT